MTLIANKHITLEEYLAYDGEAGQRYELADGIVIEMPTETPLNNTIALFLVSCFLQLGIPHYRLATNHQLEVTSAKATSRQPDLVVHSPASIAAILKDGQLLRHDQPAPLLVIEVVSNSEKDKASRQRDYIEKRQEYAERGIAEYWIVDPVAATISVLCLKEDSYQAQKFVGDETLASVVFPDLAITATQVLTAGM